MMMVLMMVREIIMLMITINMLTGEGDEDDNDDKVWCQSIG